MAGRPIGGSAATLNPNLSSLNPQNMNPNHMSMPQKLIHPQQASFNRQPVLSSLPSQISANTQSSSGKSFTFCFTTWQSQFVIVQ